MESMIMVSESELNQGAEEEVRVASAYKSPDPNYVSHNQEAYARRKSVLETLFCYSPTLMSHLLLCPVFTASQLFLLSAPVSLQGSPFSTKMPVPHRRKTIARYFPGVSVLSPQLGSRLLEGTAASFTAL